MVVSGADDQEEPEPEPRPAAVPETEPGTGPEHETPQHGVPHWPESGLPPSFGQRSTEAERPAAASPAPGAGHGGYRPLGSLPPSGPPPAGPWPRAWAWHQADDDRPEPGDEQLESGGGLDEPGGHWDEQGAPWEEPGSGWAGTVSGWAGLDGRWERGGGPAEAGPGPYAEAAPEPGAPAGSGPDADVGAGWEAPAEPGTEGGPGPGAGPEPHAGSDHDAAFGPWETYETAEGHGWAGGYGVVPEQAWARSYEDPAGPGNGQAGPGHAGPGHAGPGHAGAAAHVGYGTAAPEPEAPPEPGEQQWQAESAESLTADVLLPGRHAPPPSGWRRALYQVTGGLVRAPQSAADRRHKDLVQRARTPVAGGHHRVAVLSLKGGVGKTTTTVGLGATLASLRGDRVIAVDANPDRGTLSDKLRLETAATVRDLLNEEDQIRRYADVRAYTTQSPSGLEVLASDRDPTVSVAFSDQDYEDVARVLEHYYSVSITDCGTGLLHSAMAGVLRLADQIVLVSSPSVDGARSASATLDWLAAHNYGDLVRGAVVVLSAIRPRSKSAVDLARLEQHFAARCRAVVRIPYDAHLEEGAEVDLAQLSRATADAYLVLAAEVGDGFSWPGH
jgi:MinD-like ATPase involved in chromosome partitioning or flagellar assembly